VLRTLEFPSLNILADGLTADTVYTCTIERKLVNTLVGGGIRMSRNEGIQRLSRWEARMSQRPSSQGQCVHMRNGARA
jgi:hypothetical protein